LLDVSGAETGFVGPLDWLRFGRWSGVGSLVPLLPFGGRRRHHPILVQAQSFE